MQRRQVCFYSDGIALDGDIWIPDGLAAGERRPAVVVCSGYQGLKSIHPERFARSLVPAGYVCLSFDYRGFGSSGGQRGRLVPQEQVEDVRAAVAFLQAAPEVDARQIALLGWALGGGVVIAEAADDPHVAAVAACNPIGDGRRAVRFMHDADSWQRLLERIAADRHDRVHTGQSEIVDPFEIVRLDGETRGYVDEELYKAAGFGSGVSLESADYLLRFRPEASVARLAPRPLLLIHGDRNRLHSPEESVELHRLAGDPKELVLLEDSGHTEWMFDEHPTFRHVSDLLRRFFDASLSTPKVGVPA